MIRHRSFARWPLLLSMAAFCLSAFLTAERDADASMRDSPGLRMLEEIQSAITELAEQAKPAVVNLFPVQSQARSREGPADRPPNVSGSGSGLIIDADGHIVTNNHVIGDAPEIEVRLSDKTKLIAQVIGKAPVESSRRLTAQLVEVHLAHARSRTPFLPSAPRPVRPRKTNPGGRSDRPDGLSAPPPF